MIKDPKILAASDTESDTLHLVVIPQYVYMLAKCMYNRYPVRDQCIRACEKLSKHSTLTNRNPDRLFCLRPQGCDQIAICLGVLCHVT